MSAGVHSSALPPEGSFTSNAAVNQNSDPAPGVLVAPILPPIISTRPFAIERPRPVPP